MKLKWLSQFNFILFYKMKWLITVLSDVLDEAVLNITSPNLLQIMEKFQIIQCYNVLIKRGKPTKNKSYKIN